MDVPKLAIVIPAYKVLYFKHVLESIANQTCLDFTLYIGIDGSPDDFNDIINSYAIKIPIVHHLFSENIGEKNLVSHWERCIDLINGEEWIWLFSDDDMMESTCVENFYKCLKENESHNIFHFNVSRINEYNDAIESCQTFPNILSSNDFLAGRLKGILSSYAIEYIFKKEYFIENKRFQNFDLAWGSDDATWIKLAKKTGIKTIENSSVYWRKSRFNISTNKRNKNIILRKLYSQIQFSKWAIEIAKNQEISIETNILRELLEQWFMKSLKQSIRFFSFKNLVSILDDFYIAVNNKNRYTKEILFIYYYKCYRSIIELLKKHILNKY